MCPEAVFVASSREIVRAAQEVYQSGGRLVDSMIAALFATSAGDPAITSLAGGGLLLLRTRDGTIEVWDLFADHPSGRGPASHGFDTQDDFREVELHFGAGSATQMFHVGRATAAVPGVLPGLLALWRSAGSVPLEELVRPTARALRDGVTIEPYHVETMRIVGDILRLDPYLASIFLDATGAPLATGARFRNPHLATFLDALGEAARRDRELDGFVDETFTRAIESAFGLERGGRILPRDLASWRARRTVPSTRRFSDARITSCPPPALGGRSVAHTLELFERAGVTKTTRGDRERWRRVVASFRAVSELRAETPEILNAPDAGERFAKRLDAILAGHDSTQRREPRAPGNTTHISMVDSLGNAASATLSHGEGCGVEIPGTGIAMNNLLGESDLFPAGLGVYNAGSRIPTMMAPALIERDDGSLVALGSGGSNRIRTAVALAITSLTLDRLSPDETLREPRLHVESGRLSVESYLVGDDRSLDLARALVREEQRFEAPSLFFGGVHIAARGVQGELSAGADPRRGGVAAFASRRGRADE